MGECNLMYVEPEGVRYYLFRDGLPEFITGESHHSNVYIYENFELYRNQSDLFWETWDCEADRNETFTDIFMTLLIRGQEKMDEEIRGLFKSFWVEAIPCIGASVPVARLKEGIPTYTVVSCDIDIITGDFGF
jgi:hypothetical protein